MKVTTEFENMIKLIILGNASVGKSNFIFRFTSNQFTEEKKEAIGFEYQSKTIAFGNSKSIIKLQIWDTPGQDKYMSVNKNLILRVQGIILMYDISKRESFDNLKYWLKSIKEISEVIPIILVANKNDVEDRLVSTEEGAALAKEFNLSFVEASAKADVNVQETFQLITGIILDKVKSKAHNTSIEPIKLSYQQKKQGGNCNT